MSLAEHTGITPPSDLSYHSYATGETLPLEMPVFHPSGEGIEGYRIMAGFYCTGDSTTLTLSAGQVRQFLQIQAVGRISPSLLQLFSPRGVVGEPECPMTPKERLLKRILALRDSIETEKGMLAESYPLIREDRER